jgi:hypothetical protein
VSRHPCTLRQALGETEECPGGSCPFWDGDACALSAVDGELLRSPELSRHLLVLRRTLERARADEELVDASTVFHRLLNEEQAAEA